MTNPVKWNGKTYDFKNIDKGGARLRGVKYGPAIWLGKMYYNDGKRGYMSVDTDGPYSTYTPQTFCRTLGLPYKGAHMYTGNKLKKAYCDQKLGGPPFDDYNPKAYKYFFDANCKKADVTNKKITNLSQCTGLAKPGVIRKGGYDGCDSWVWCKN